MCRPGGFPHARPGSGESFGGSVQLSIWRLAELNSAKDARWKLDLSAFWVVGQHCLSGQKLMHQSPISRVLEPGQPGTRPVARPMVLICSCVKAMQLCQAIPPSRNARQQGEASKYMGASAWRKLAAIWTLARRRPSKIGFLNDERRDATKGSPERAGSQLRPAQIRFLTQGRRRPPARRSEGHLHVSHRGILADA